MDRRRIGRTDFVVTPLAFGAFKIGRNEGIKYPSGYDLPDDDHVAELLHGVLDLGINLIDTAPAYGVSEERIGRCLNARRREFVLSTKVGETFENGRSSFDFSSSGIRRSVQRSLRRLRTDVLDLVFIHSDGRDQTILEETDAVPALIQLRDAGLVRAIGFSGKTVAGAQAALRWADALMIAYHPDDRSHEPALAAAAEAGVGVLVKKPLAAGHLPAAEALPFVLAPSAVSCAVVGSLNLDHVRDNLACARCARGESKVESRK